MQRVCRDRNTFTHKQFYFGLCPIEDGSSGSCPIDDGTLGSCPIDDAINLADNSDCNDNDKHDQFCQNEKKVLSEGCYQTDLDMAQLDRQQIYLQHITDELSSTKDLAFRSNISVPTTSRIFDKWTHVVSIRLKFLIQWPKHEELQATMPAVFQQFLQESCSHH